MNRPTLSRPVAARCFSLPRVFAVLILLAFPFGAFAAGRSGAKAADIVRVKNLSTSNSATPLVAIATVEVGDAGNQGANLSLPSSGTNLTIGGVPSSFRMGTFEVSVGQYVAFLNAVAAVTNSTNASLYSPSLMGSPTNVSGIARTGSGTPASPFVYAPSGNPGHPMAYVTWFNAARFANWMHNGATSGANTEDGAYALNGQNTSGAGIVRNAEAKWWIPSEDEWFKAAYYKGGGISSGYFLFPARSDSVPRNDNPAEANQANFKRFGQTFSVTQTNSYDPTQIYLTPVGFFTNSPAPYGTFDQGGNLDEWTDTAVQTSFGNARVTRGGSWNSGGLNNNADPRSVNLPNNPLNTLGFRLACANASTNAGPGLSGSVIVSVLPSSAALVAPDAVVSFRVRPGQFTVNAQAHSADPALQAVLPTSTTNFPTSPSNRTTFVTLQITNGSVFVTNVPGVPPPF